MKKYGIFGEAEDALLAKSLVKAPRLPGLLFHSGH